MITPSMMSREKRMGLVTEWKTIKSTFSMREEKEVTTELWILLIKEITGLRIQTTRMPPN
jgi:hypothetical protein